MSAEVMLPRGFAVNLWQVKSLRRRGQQLSEALFVASILYRVFSATMNEVIYVETSIPSFYFETRPGAPMQARREWTREWWELAKWQDELVSSL
jgi:hypothetical protein